MKNNKEKVGIVKFKNLEVSDKFSFLFAIVINIISFLIIIIIMEIIIALAFINAKLLLLVE